MKSKKIRKKDMKALLRSQQGEADAVLMYERLSAVVKDPADAAAFKRLASDEARHESVFKAYTGAELAPKKAKAIFVPLLYRLLGREKVYPLIASGEYKAVKKYKRVVRRFPDVRSVQDDEQIHGDAVLSLLK